MTSMAGVMLDLNILQKVAAEEGPSTELLSRRSRRGLLVYDKRRLHWCQHRVYNHSALLSTHRHIAVSATDIHLCGFPPIDRAVFLRENSLQGNSTLARKPIISIILHVPASLFIPALPASNHDALQIPHTSLSLPSFTQPHLDAATASIAGGLLSTCLA